MTVSGDQLTAQGFATSWNNLPEGSVYTQEQVKDWFAPVSLESLKDKSILELGCGNASLMTHLVQVAPKELVGVDLGDSVVSAQNNLLKTGFEAFKIIKADMTEFRSDGYDFVYSIGVLHHLNIPEKGFAAIIKNTKPGGAFHCWVYGYEGNALIRYLVEPLRLVASRLPWWFTKYALATPLSVLVYIYAHLVKTLSRFGIFSFLPLYEYCIWISKREFLFFRHVVFDQLVARKTNYIRKEEIRSWLMQYPAIDQETIYIVQRNGNSWKFGGQIQNVKT